MQFPWVYTTMGLHLVNFGSAGPVDASGRRLRPAAGGKPPQPFLNEEDKNMIVRINLPTGSGSKIIKRTKDAIYIRAQFYGPWTSVGGVAVVKNATSVKEFIEMPASDVKSIIVNTKGKASVD